MKVQPDDIPPYHMVNSRDFNSPTSVISVEQGCFDGIPSGHYWPNLPISWEGIPRIVQTAVAGARSWNASLVAGRKLTDIAPPS